MARSTIVNPVDVAKALEQGLAHHRAGRPTEAEAAYRRVLAVQPNHSGALHLLGVIAHQAGKQDIALELWGKAIAASPTTAEFHENLGNALQEQGKLDEAVTAYRRALELKPDHPKTHNNLGNALIEQGKLDQAVTAYRRALKLKPNFAEAHYNLGKALSAQGKLGEAVTAYRRALKFEPNFAGTHNNLGNALKEQGKLDEAVTAYRRALELEPDYPKAHNNLGAAHQKQGKLDEAVAAYRRALELDPSLLEAHDNLGTALLEQGRPEEAVAAYRRALDIKAAPGIEVKLATVLPVIPESKDALLRARQRFEAQVDALGKRGLSLDDPYKEVGTANFYLAYHGMKDRDVQQAVARFYLKACPSLAWSAPATVHEGRNRLRVGFVSRHFRNHAVSWCYRGSIERLDRARFDVVVFTFDDKADSITREIRANADRAVSLPTDLAGARETVTAQALDVLVYTDIGMDPLTYFLAFARLAPVQCVMAGHPVTTGIPNLDYFISNELTEPLGAEAHYSETLVRLATNPVYFPRPTPPARPRTREDFGFGPGEHPYACPYSLFKFHPDFDAVLAAILRRDGAGRLVLVKGKDPNWTKLLARRLAKAMPDVIDRVHWLPFLDFEDFLSLLVVSDVLLEPLHFGGGNTARQALAMAKPVVTLPGDFMRGRMCYGNYRRMGLTECVAKDAEDYVDIAVRLGTDPDWRREVEARIAAASPVLYEDLDAVRVLERFFLTAAARAGMREK